MLNKIPSRLLVVLLVVVAYIACRVGVNWSQRHQSEAQHVASSKSEAPGMKLSDKPVVYGRVVGTLTLGRKVTLWLLPSWSDDTLTFSVDVGQYDRSKEITTGIVYVCGDAWYSPFYAVRPDSDKETKRAKTLEGVEAQEPSKVGTVARFASFGAAK